MSKSTPGFSRRQFLKATAAVSAASSLPLLNTSLARAAAAQPTAGLGAQSLDSGWEHYRGPLAGPWEVWRGDEIAVWEKVTLPHCFNHYDGCDPDTPYYRGQGWYRTTLKVPVPAPHARTLLHFEGAGQTSAVYIGSTCVGRHVGGYDEFVVDITDALRSSDGPAQLAVLCDNAPDLDRSPSDLSDFSLFGGLYRHVHLVQAPAVSVEALHVIARCAADAQTAQVAVRARLYNPEAFTEELRISLEVTGPDGAVVFTAAKTLGPWNGSQELASFAIPRPQLWSPAHPALYRCMLRLSSAHGESTVSERFGVRHAEFVEHGPFLLNGERLLLRGTQRHMDHAGYAAAQPDELIRKELTLVKEMGINFLRLGHYQQTRLVLELCDEMGILVWEEAPWCRSGVGSEKWQQQVAGALAHMIDQHRNHPCVLLWGLGNEDDWPGEYPSIDHAAIRAFMTKMNDLAHGLDAERPTSLRRCDFARDIPDIYSPSIWAGWYKGNYHDYQKLLEVERYRVKHLLHIEWGADSHARRHAEAPNAVVLPGGPLSGETEAAGPNNHDWSESYACDLFDWHLKVQETLPWLAGSAQWALKDFTTPLRAENPVPRVNQKGVLERDLTRKEGYFVFQSYWSQRPMAHIYGHSWPVRWGAEGEAKLVKVYSNCSNAELFVNGKSAGVRQRDSQDFPAAGLRWTVSFAKGRNHLRVAANRDGQTVTDELEFDYQTEKWAAPARLELREKARSADAITIEARLLDAVGVPCLDARTQVRFSLAGAGRLRDNLGTSNGSRVVQMYNGRAEIAVELSGACAASVRGEGLAPAFVRLEPGERRS